MHWTSENPTQPGFYWHRYAGETRYRLYEVNWSHGGHSPAGPSDKLHIDRDYRFIETLETSEWCAVTVEPPP